MFEAKQRKWTLQCTTVLQQKQLFFFWSETFAQLMLWLSSRVINAFPVRFCFHQIFVICKKKKKGAYDRSVIFCTEASERVTGHATQSKRWKKAHRVASALHLCDIMQRPGSNSVFLFQSEDFLCAFEENCSLVAHLHVSPRPEARGLWEGIESHGPNIIKVIYCQGKFHSSGPPPHVKQPADL